MLSSGTLFTHEMDVDDEYDISINIFSAVNMARPLQEFTRFTRWMQTDQQVAANPVSWLELWVCL